MSARHGEGEEVGWLRAQLAAMTAERDQLRQHLDARQELDQMLMTSAPAADGTGPIARVQGPRAAAHRTPKEARWLRVVPGFALAALASLEKVWHVHRAATVTAGFITAGAITTAAVVPATAPFHGILAAPAVTAPAPGLYGAVPVPSASLRLTGSSFTRPALDAKSAGPPVVSIPVPASASPSPSPSQSSQPSPSGTPDTFATDSPQPTWQDTTDGQHHRQWGQQDSPSPTDTPTDTSTPTAAPDTGTPAAPSDTAIPSPAAS